jgi:hypothetical protein
MHRENVLVVGSVLIFRQIHLFIQTMDNIQNTMPVVAQYLAFKSVPLTLKAKW